MKQKSRVFKVPCENGYYIFKLEKLLTDIKKSKYILSKELYMEYKVLNRYARGNLTRFDANVIARICDFCDCQLKDILEYMPNKKL